MIILRIHDAFSAILYVNAFIGNVLELHPPQIMYCRLAVRFADSINACRIKEILEPVPGLYRLICFNSSLWHMQHRVLYIGNDKCIDIGFRYLFSLAIDICQFRDPAEGAIANLLDSLADGDFGYVLATVESRILNSCHLVRDGDFRQPRTPPEGRHADVSDPVGYVGRCQACAFIESITADFRRAS